MKRIGTPLMLVMILATTGCGDGGSPEEPSAASSPQLPRVGVEQLQRIIAQADADDQVLVLDFWATWCIPCVQILPPLHEELKQLEGVRPVTVTLDGPDAEQDAIAFLAEHHALENAYLLEPDSDEQVAVVQALGQSWNDLVVPAILVYDRDGQLAAEFIGGSNPDQEVQRVVQKVRSLLTGS